MVTKMQYNLKVFKVLKVLLRNSLTFLKEDVNFNLYHGKA
jgi:hypothetical protein